jgi:hypothetical protein
MSKMRMPGYQLDKQSTITGIGGLALLVVGLIVHQTWMELLGISMTMIGVRGQERGLWAGSCGMVLIMFGLVFSEPLRTIIGCTFFLVGILVWRAGKVRRV